MSSKASKVFSMIDVAKRACPSSSFLPLPIELTYLPPLLLHTDNTPKSIWIAYRGKIYDFTGFESDHPGGDDLILRHAGKDMGEAMADPEEHVHSRSAYEMMDDFQIGVLGGSEKVVSEGEFRAGGFGIGLYVGVVG